MRLISQRHFGFQTRLAALYAAFFALAGIHLPFFPVWLKAKGLDDAGIGLVLAAPMIVRLCAVPIASRLADRRDALRATLVTLTTAAIAGYTLVGLANGMVGILIAYTVAACAFTPVMPLTETYALKGLGQRGLAYGPVRLWGSASFIVGSLAAGIAADRIPARNLIWMIAAASALIALAAFTLEPVSSEPHASERQTARASLLRDPTFIAVLASAGLIQASHAVFYGFSAVQWRAAGLDGTTIAALWALGVVAEMVLFAVQGRLPPFFRPSVLLMIGAGGAALRWSAMAFDPPTFELPWLQLLHALSFGATHLGAIGFVSRYAPPGQGATAQGYLAVALGALLAGAMSLSGLLVQAFGAHAYAAMALTAVAGGVCGYVVKVTRHDAAL
ncbi:MAG TPA: MFS transporter [Pseudolabrys sp.]|nr:MFS transporter [Pseudolabrys sp.]